MTGRKSGIAKITNSTTALPASFFATRRKSLKIEMIQGLIIPGPQYLMKNIDRLEAKMVKLLVKSILEFRPRQSLRREVALL